MKKDKLKECNISNKHNDNCCSHEHSGCGCESRQNHCSCKSEDKHIGCGCGHEHEHANGKILLLRLISGGVLFIAGLLTEKILPETKSLSQHIPDALFIISYIILGYDIVFHALKNIFKGHVFDENFLMSVASIGAFIVGERPDAVAVMLFYQVGEALQDRAAEKSRASISQLMDIRPDYANIEKNGIIEKISPEKVNIGDIILVKPGEKIPLDGCIADGATYLDTVALTGESVPQKVSVGDNVLSGSLNTGSPVRIKVEKAFGESTVSKILDMVEHAQNKKAKSEKFITSFAKYYTPIVMALAVLIMLLPPLLIADEQFSTWIYRGLIFLVVSCPCALVVSIPLGFFAGIGCSSKNGILVKGSTYIESLSKLSTVVFDKTGTLTKGTFSVKEIYSKIPESDLLRYAAYAEYYSTHPIAESIKASYKLEIETNLISDYTELSGMGISAVIDNVKVLAGNDALMNKYGISYKKPISTAGSIVYIAADGKFAGCITISDEIKPDSKTAIENLRKLNIKSVMLTGDREASANYVATQLGIDEVHSQLLPQGKVEKLEQILNAKESGKTVAFIGDGINDAPVLMRSDIGIAMGGIGSDSAIEAADIVLMTDEPSKVNDAVKISSKTMRIIKENIVFAIGIKILVMILSVIGISTMWLAIFADVGVSLLAVLNSLRALYYKIK